MTSLNTAIVRRWTTAARLSLGLLLGLAGTAASAADMTASISGVPAVLNPGQVVTGAQLSCSNAVGAGAATNAQCSVTATSGTISGLTCTPATGGSLAEGASIVCSFTLTVPGTRSGADEATTFINLTAQTGADNDSNPANNETLNTSIILDTVDDTCLCPAGVPGQQVDLNANDQVPIGSTWTLLPGATCGNASLNTVGTLTYDAPAGGTCTVPYQVCAPAPNGTVCDTAVFTSTANPATQADMVPSFPVLPGVLRPGQTTTGLELTCTNNGPAAANAAFCTPTVSAGSITNVICTPPTPASVATGAAISCTFDHTAPGTQGGADEPTLTVNFTGQTGSTNDSNGGANGAAGNNAVVSNVPMLDALDDSATPAASATAQAADLAANDQAPTGATWAIAPGGTCSNATLSAAGGLSYDAPATGSCTVNYQVCGAVPYAATCDTATFTATVAAAADVGVTFSGVPAIASPGQAQTATLVCTNLSGITATGVTCSATAQDSLGATVALTTGACVASAGSAASLPPAATLSCPLSWTSPGTAGGVNTPAQSVSLQGQTHATNDGVPANNSTTASLPLIDAVDDTVDAAAGTASTRNLLGNDDRGNARPVAGAAGTPGADSRAAVVGTWPAGFSLLPDGTLQVGATVASGTYRLDYRLCDAAEPAVCDTASVTVRIGAGIDVSTSVGTPVLSAPGVFDVPLTVRVNNLGDASLTIFNVQADNPLAPVFPGASTTVVAGSMAVSGPGCAAPATAFDGNTRTALLSGTSALSGGQSCVIGFTVRADFGANPVPATPLTQTAYASGTADAPTANPGWGFPGGTPVPPAAASSTDVASDTVTLAGQRLGIALSLAGIEGLPNGRYRATFEVVGANTGTVPATHVQIRNPLASAFPAPVTLHSAGNMLRVAGDPASCAINPSFGLGSPHLLTGSASWPVGTRCTLRFDVEFTPNGQTGPFNHSATLSSHAAPTATPGADPTGPALAQDLSDAGTDPTGSNPGVPGDSGGTNDPTPVRLPAGISGSVWSDMATSGAGNRQRDNGEAGLQGWVVQALYPTGTQLNGSDVSGQVVRNSQGRLAEAMTGADGRYLLTSLPAGRYDIRFFAPGATGLGAAYGTPVNGERGQPQAGSTVNTAAKVLQVTLTDGALVPEQSLPVDPSGVVYDSVTRQPVAGATVTLLDGAGAPLPAACVQPGQQNQVTTSGGAAGFYRFDINPGAAAACPNAVASYQLRVTPPTGYVFPSTLITAAAALPQQTGATYLVAPQPGAPQAGQSTTYHLALSIGPGSADIIHNHIPIDAVAVPGSALLIDKTVDRRTAQIGDIVTYTIRLRNAGLTPLPAGEVNDSLPMGFKLMPGTLSFTFGNNTAATGLADSTVRGFPGPVLSWRLPVLNPGEELRFNYRVRIDIGADKGDGTNRASATAGAVRSGVAQATVRISGGVFGSEAQVLGKVYVDCNQNKLQDQGERGIPGVRIVMQDGTAVTTDENGLFSLQGLRPITHVLRVDPRSLPVGARLGTTSSRNMADPESLFIDLKNGELHRAEFREQSCFPKVLEQVRERRAKVAPVVPMQQTGKDDPWGLKFDSTQHPLRRTPAIDNANTPAAAPAKR